VCVPTNQSIQSITKNRAPKPGNKIFFEKNLDFDLIVTIKKKIKKKLEKLFIFFLFICLAHKSTHHKSYLDMKIKFYYKISIFAKLFFLRLVC